MAFSDLCPSHCTACAFPNSVLNLLSRIFHILRKQNKTYFNSLFAFVCCQFSFHLSRRHEIKEQLYSHPSLKVLCRQMKGVVDKWIECEHRLQLDIYKQLWIMVWLCFSGGAGGVIGPDGEWESLWLFPPPRGVTGQLFINVQRTGKAHRSKVGYYLSHGHTKGRNG